MAEGVNKLSEEQLFECLKSLNVPTRLSDIKTPTKEFMTRVLECFLKDLQVDIMHHSLRTFQAIKHIEYPEIMEEGQTLLLLVMFINFITTVDGLIIFARDIVNPKPKRTKKILNYLIVFWRYFLTKYANFQAFAEKFQEEKKEADKIAEDNEELEVKYNELLEFIKNEFPIKEELISLNASKVEKCRFLEKQREMLTEENNASKKKENDLQARLTSTDVAIVSAKEEIKELEELILTSPEKINSEIQKLKDAISEIDSKINKKEKEIKDKKKNFEILKKTLESNEKDLEEMKIINKSVETFGNAVKAFIIDFQKCQEEKENLKKLESELHIKEELQSINEHKYTKIHLNYKKQKESYNGTFQMLQRNLTQEQDDLILLKATNSKLDQEMDKEANAIVKIVKTCKDAENTTLKLQMNFKSEMESISNKFVSDCGEIKQCILSKYAL